MTIIKHTLTSLFLLALMIIAGCKGDDIDPKAAALNEQLDVLMNDGRAWVLSNTGSVMKDGVDVSNQFEGFTLTIGNKTYTTQNSLRHVWSGSGTWDFVDDNPERIIKDGSVEISVSQSQNGLTLTFNAGSAEGGRVNAVSGEYVFTLISD